ncbi:MAG: DUF4367 domain-containing protein [Clostridia bacterium]|nr:DUF4367 domain-containing protein [Clostridia bacterium]
MNIEALFLEVYGKRLDAEFAEAIAAAEAEPYRFSPRFEERMQALLQSGRPAAKRSVPIRRILWIAAAAVLVLCSLAFTSKRIRSSVAGFLVQVFGDHVEYSDPEITKMAIEEEYGLVPVPEGFVEYKTIKTEDYICIFYVKGENTMLCLKQRASSNVSESVDNEHGVFEEYGINGKTVLIYLTETTAHAAWTEDGYYFSLAYTSVSQVDLDQIIDYISSVAVK